MCRRRMILQIHQFLTLLWKQNKNRRISLWLVISEWKTSDIFDVLFAADTDMMLPFPDLELFSEPQENTENVSQHKFYFFKKFTCTVFAAHYGSWNTYFCETAYGWPFLWKNSFNTWNKSLPIYTPCMCSWPVGVAGGGKPYDNKIT